jgi:hypothetical protein
MVTYSAPFYPNAKQASADQDINEAIGVVTIDISINRLREVIDTLDLGPSGFAALTSVEGDYIYHPFNNLAYIKQSKSLLDIAKEKADSDRITLAGHVARQDRGVMEHFSTSKQAPSWLIFEPI